MNAYPRRHTAGGPSSPAVPGLLLSGLVLCLLALCAPAQAAPHGVQAAQSTEVTADWDELSRSILCFGAHQVMNERLNAHVVRVFSAPERDVFGRQAMRLYVGYVQDPAHPDRGWFLLKGPRAESWESPRVAPGLERTPADKRPLRYWIARADRLPDGSLQSSTVEIDLESAPPVLRSMSRQAGRPAKEQVERLETVPLTPPLRLLLGSFASPRTETRALALREFSLGAPGTQPATRAAAPQNPDYFAVSSRDGARCAIHTLPKALFWALEKVVAAPPQDDPRGVFVVDMLEEYLPPTARTQGESLTRRVQVRVGLAGLSFRVIEDGLVYDTLRGTYVRAKPLRR